MADEQEANGVEIAIKHIHVLKKALISATTVPGLREKDREILEKYLDTIIKALDEAKQELKGSASEAYKWRVNEEARKRIAVERRAEEDKWKKILVEELDKQEDKLNEHFRDRILQHQLGDSEDE